MGAGRSATPVSDRLRANAAKAQQSSGGDGFGFGDAFGLVGKGFMEAIDIADKGRQLYQGFAGEMGDVVAGSPFGGNPVVKSLANVATGNPLGLRGLVDPETGERDTNFDLGEVTGGGIEQGFLGRVDWDDDLPGPLRAGVGFAGDIATDPLTYATLGVGGVVKSGVKGGVRAAIPAGREALAMQAARNIGKEGVEGVSRELGDRLTRELGKRGQGALTRRGLARVGATPEQAARVLGQEGTLDFGARVGVGRFQKRIAGSGRLAENVQDLKGVIKSATGSSQAGRLARKITTAAKYGEAKARQEILSGGMNAPQAARALAMLGEGKGRSWRWFDETIRESEKLGPDGKGLRKISDDEARAFTHALEQGDFSNPLVQDLAQFFSKKGDELLAAGVPFKKRARFVPHRLTEKAQRAYDAGDDSVRNADIFFKEFDADKAEVFQRMRQDDRTIAEINQQWRAQGHDFDLLEDDVRTLLTEYVAEGQQGMMRAFMTGDKAVEMGLVDDIGGMIDPVKFEKRIQKLAGRELDAIKSSIKSRRKAINKGIKAGQRNVEAVGADLNKARAASQAADDRVAKLAADRVELERKLQTATESVDLLQKNANQLRGREKAAATRAIKKAQAKVDELYDELGEVSTRARGADGRAAKAAKELAAADDAFQKANKNVEDLVAARAELDAAPVARDAVEAQTAAQKAAFERQAADAKFTNVENEFQVAEETAQFLAADVTKVQDKLVQTTAEYDDWLKRVEATPRSKKGTVFYERKAEADMVREQIEQVRQILKNTSDPVAQDIAKLEAQAVMADAAAVMASKQSKRLMSEFNAGIDLLDNPRFQDMIVEQFNDTMVRLEKHLGTDMQIDAWYKEALETQKRINANPSEFMRGFARVLKAHRSFMNYWKGFALSSPGFVLRNFYSGAFGMYLDDISLAPGGPLHKFGRYHHKVMKDGPEAAQVWAAKTYSPEVARQLDEAHSVAAASGWGITAVEFSDDPVRRGVSKNPLSASNPYSYAMRHMSENVEAYLRGGHALGVLQRGGSYDEALGRVQKFHFNYRDISEFDRGMKDAMPFWTFFSRNIALQMSVFAKKPNKLSRSYFNAKRNIEAQADGDDQPMPGWMRAMSPIRVGSGDRYLVPDIPSIRFPGQIDEMTSGGPVGLAEELISNMAPALKTPYQLATNRDVFTGRDYRNSLEQYSDEGFVPRRAPIPFNLPGVRNVLDVLPGVENIDGTLLMQDNVQAALTDLNPMFGRAARVAPTTDRGMERRAQFARSQLGIPLDYNDPGRQAGAIAADRREMEDAADAIQRRIRLEKMVSEGR
jgi:hypothetical protein